MESKDAVMLVPELLRLTSAWDKISTVLGAHYWKVQGVKN